MHLIHFKGVDRPVGIDESVRVLRNKLFACLLSRRCTRAARPDFTSPVAAKRGVEDYAQVLERRRHVAISLESRQRLAPRGRVG